MKLDQYIAAINEKLAGSPIISAIEISDERILGDRRYFRARLTLINSDFLEIAESFTIQYNQIFTLDYRFNGSIHLNNCWENAGIVLSIFQVYPIFPIMFISAQKLTSSQGNLEIS